jgi:deazaflavin-dependent oxidoreductase (nitroreductase family)
VPDERPAFQRPDWVTRRVFNPAVAGLTRLGLSLFGSRVLRVQGRRSGEWRETPVNPLALEGDRYLVAARGETQWVRNLRAAGGGELRVGRRREGFTASEVQDEAIKASILREYLRRWKWEVGAFFGGVGADSPEDELRTESRRHPIFRLEGKEAR